jgi:SAM-dependent methyltransferase
MDEAGQGREPAWLGSGTGAALLDEEMARLAAALDSVFGDEFVQLGVWGSAGAFRGLARTRRQAVVDRRPGPGVDLVTELDDLAIAGDSVDAVLLPHTLETVGDPHAVLREVDRILRPDGHVVVLGFNPLGWWGARHYLSRRRFPRGVERMIAEYRVRDWLRLLSFSVQHAACYHFRAPLYQPGLTLEPSPPPGSGVAARLRQWPGFAACYLLVARKEAFSMTPVRLAQRRRPRLVVGLSPTTRNAA